LFDIEPVLDPVLPIAESSEAERLPAPPRSRDRAIGALSLDGNYDPSASAL
jgi:hypothetical protein